MLYVFLFVFILGLIGGILLNKYKPESNYKHITKINPFKQKRYWGFEKSISDEIKLLYLNKDIQSCIFSCKHELTLYIISGEIILISNPFKETIRAGETYKIPANTVFSLYSFYSTHMILSSKNINNIIQTLTNSTSIKPAKNHQ